MKRIEIKQKCACCGNVFDTFEIGSSFIAEGYLDGKNSGYNPFSELKKCPNCHYVNTNLEELVSDDVVDIVNSEEYKSLFRENNDSQNELSGQEDYRITIFKAFLMLNKDIKSRIDVLLQLCWAYEDMKKYDEARKIRKDVVSEFEIYLNSDSEIEVSDGLIFVDCLRQLGLFEEAANILNELEPAFDEEIFSHPSEYIIFIFEKKLVNKADNKPYKYSEVKLV